MIILLSYPLTAKTLLYPNTPAPVIHQLRSMEQGDNANTSSITLSTHSGTHVDAPRHFCKQGKTIADCLTVDTTFFPTYCIDMPKPVSEEITVSDLERSISLVQNAEALLIRTGWHTLRSENPEQYITNHPWVSPDVPQFLREKCPGLYLFGLDQISVSSPLHRQAGHECHRKFLCGKKPILLLEDLNLSDTRIKEAFRMHIYPHFIDDIDGVPVTVIADIQ
ncbi:MAG: cyclase family protein [Methanomicrobiales archaeon]|nr:cyclase family protein [Methanomicrobiales archaeon]